MTTTPVKSEEAVTGAGVSARPSGGKPVRHRRDIRFFSILVLLGIAAAAVYYFWGDAIAQRFKKNGGTALEGSTAKPTGVISVNTVHPVRKTLVRQVEQAGSILPEALAELYAKVPGYLKFIQRDVSHRCVGQLVANQIVMILSSSFSSPAESALHGLGATEIAWQRSPQKNIGSFVNEGDVIMILDVPDLKSDIAQKSAILQQREAELIQNRAMSHTF